MFSISDKIISQCQNELSNQGLCQLFIQLPQELEDLVDQKDLQKIDVYMGLLVQKKGALRLLLQSFISINHIEYIVSYRQGDDPDEEDGIWHDDGSRLLAYSLSLTKTEVQGGDFLFRHKGADNLNRISTPEFGTLTIFKTGIDNFEHKVTKVIKGERIITAGWIT